MTNSEQEIYTKLKASVRDPYTKVFSGYAYVRGAAVALANKEFTDVFAISKNFVLLISDKTLELAIKPEDLLDLMVADAEKIEDPGYIKERELEIEETLLKLEQTWRRVVRNKHVLKSLNQNHGAVRTWFDIFDKKAELHPLKNKEYPIINSDFLNEMGVTKQTPIYLVNTVGNIYGLAGAYFELLQAYSFLTNGPGEKSNLFKKGPSRVFRRCEYGGIMYASKKPVGFKGYQLERLPKEEERLPKDLTRQAWCLFFEDLVARGGLNKGPVSQNVFDLELFYSLLNTLGSIDSVVEYLSFKNTFISRCLALNTVLTLNGEDTFLEIFNQHPYGVSGFTDSALKDAHLVLETRNPDSIFMPNSNYANKLEALAIASQSLKLGKKLCPACQKYDFLVAAPLFFEDSYKCALGREKAGVFTQTSLKDPVCRSNNYFLLCRECTQQFDRQYGDFWTRNPEIFNQNLKLFKDQNTLKAILTLDACKYLQYFLDCQTECEIDEALQKIAPKFLEKAYAYIKEGEFLPFKTFYYFNNDLVKFLSKYSFNEPRFSQPVALNKFLIHKSFITPIFNNKAFLLTAIYQQSAFGIVIEKLPSFRWTNTNTYKKILEFFSREVEKLLINFYKSGV